MQSLCWWNMIFMCALDVHTFLKSNWIVFQYMWYVMAKALLCYGKRKPVLNGDDTCGALFLDFIWNQSSWCWLWHVGSNEEEEEPWTTQHRLYAWQAQVALSVKTRIGDRKESRKTGEISLHFSWLLHLHHVIKRKS